MDNEKDAQAAKHEQAKEDLDDQNNNNINEEDAEFAEIFGKATDKRKKPPVEDRFKNSFSSDDNFGSSSPAKNQ